MKTKLTDRIQQIQENENALNSIFPIADMQSSYYYFGMALLSKKAYINWMYSKIVEKYQDIWPNNINEASVFLLVKYANELTHDDDYDYEAIPLMKKLIIEPFHELNKERVQ